MATIAQQSRIEQLDTFVLESVKDLCATMLNWTPEPGAHACDFHPRPFALNEVNGCIGFGGAMTGSIFFSCPESLTMAMARTILGHDYPRGAREVSDVVGELTNMLAGGCKSRLCDQECPVVMSIPNVIRGTLIRVAIKNVAFMLQHEFALPIIGESFKVITLGKFE